MLNLHKICRSLETKKCIQHGERPIAFVQASSIQLLTCCTVFHRQLQKKIELDLAKQSEEEIQNLLKRW